MNTKNKIIICLVGEFASGKGVVVDYLVEKYHASSFRFSRVLRDLLERLCLPDSRENIQKISSAIRHSFGDDIIGRVIAEDVKNEKNSLIVVDGARRMSDIKHLSHLEGFKLIRVVADLKVRYDRLVTRNENPGDKNKSYEQFLKDHNNKSDMEVPEVMSRAGLELDNNGGLDDLRNQIDEIIFKS